MRPYVPREGVAIMPQLTAQKKRRENKTLYGVIFPAQFLQVDFALVAFIKFITICSYILFPRKCKKIVKKAFYLLDKKNSTVHAADGCP